MGKGVKTTSHEAKSSLQTVLSNEALLEPMLQQQVPVVTM